MQFTQGKKPIWKRLHTVRFQFDDVVVKTKLWRQKKGEWLPRVIIDQAEATLSLTY